MSVAHIASSTPQSVKTVLTVVLLAFPSMLFGCTQLGDWPHGQNPAVPSFAPLVQQVLPAVVNVSVEQRPNKRAASREAMPGADQAITETALSGHTSASLDELLRRFFDQQVHKGEPNSPGLALGSGFIIDRRGYVVTDNHVLENADSITVTFQDTTQHAARIVGRDTLTDLALLKVDVDHPLPYVRWGDSDNTRVGDWVLAVGNPFGLDNTVSSGIVSARGRDIHAGPYDNFLQIDASINRGNSGGPTFNLDGAVIGINTAIYSPNGGSVGIGFAIPANLAKPVIEQLEANGRVERGWLGVQIQPVTAEIAQGFGLAKPAGALVAGISANGPAARAGFARGDVILAVNGKDIERMRDLPLVVAEIPIGQSAAVTVWRNNSKISLHPMIGELPTSPQIAEIRPASLHPERAKLGAGLSLAPLTRQSRARLRVGAAINGVVVTAIGDGSPFAGLDLQPGDVIETVNQQPVVSPQDAYNKLDNAAAFHGKTVLLLINRQGSDRFLAVSPSGGAGKIDG